jgi:NADH-quinone oxidoreductase subunit I
MYGFGLLKGMKVTMKKFFKKKVTELYPEVKPSLPPRSHGSFKFEIDKCIACNMCADACPNGVIKVDFTKDEKGKRILEGYDMNLGYCLFCGFCVKACPKDALNFKTDFDMTCYHREDTNYSWKKRRLELETPEHNAEVAATVEKSEKEQGV